MLSLYRELKSDGFPSPLRAAFSISVKQRFLPNRTYLYMDYDGFVYDPPVLQWNIGLKKIWQDDQEAWRQRWERKALESATSLT